MYTKIQNIYILGMICGGVKQLNLSTVFGFYKFLRLLAPGKTEKTYELLISVNYFK